MANSLFLIPSPGTAVINATSLLLGDGTVTGPAIAFAADPTTGFYRSNAGTISVAGAGTAGPNFTATQVNVPASGEFRSNSLGTKMVFPSADGLIALQNNANTIGARIKVDALPTIGAGFGTGPAVTTGSTAFAGSVNVGTGGTATTGSITFGGTAFPSAPFVTCMCSSGAVPTIATATVSGVNFTTSVAWPANTILNWHIISARA